MNDLEIFEKFGRRLVLIGRKIYNLSDDLQMRDPLFILLPRGLKC